MDHKYSFKVLKNGSENNLIAPAKDDAGWDLIAASDPVIVREPNKKQILYIEYDTGVIIQPAEGFFTLLFPRSSVSKYQLSLCNSVGVIDAGYRDSIKLRFRWLGRGTQPSKDLIYKKGDKIGQLVFAPFISLVAHQTDSLEASERGTGGFGSTGV